MTSVLRYRLFQESDLPGLLDLWEDNTSWGKLCQQTWHEWYTNTPHGDCIVAVAEDDTGRAVGQLVLTPCLVSIGGKDTLGGKLSAPIVHKDLRSLMFRLDHPSIELLRVATDVARQQSVGVIYTIPDPSWLPLYKLGNRSGLPYLSYNTTQIPCLAKEISEIDSLIDDSSLFVGSIANFEMDLEYNGLWRQALSDWSFAAAVVRGPLWLQWNHGPHLVIETRHHATAELVGYAVVNRKTGLLMDVLSKSKEFMDIVLRHTLCFIYKHHSQHLESGVNEIKAMAIPALIPSLKRLGFVSVDYNFAFGVNILDDALAGQAGNPDVWYVTPGD